MADKERRELGPDEIWLGDTGWYINLTDYTLTHDGEQIGTCYSVRPTALLNTALVERGERTPEGDEIRGPPRHGLRSVGS